MNALAEPLPTSTVPVPYQAPTPLSLIEKAIDRGLDVDQLDKLLMLQERMDKTRAEQEYANAMMQAQRDMPAVIKDAYNQQTKSNYARLESVNTTIKPVYTKHGFSLSFYEQDTTLPGHCRVSCDVMHIGGHSRSYHADIPLDGQGIKGNANMTATHGKGSTISYGKRYLVCMIFNVTIADEDTDGNREDPLLTDDQTYQLNDLIDSIEQTGHKFESAKFYAWLGVKNMAEMRNSHYGKAVDQLGRKLAKLQGGAA
jgi:hypothetical protein